MAARGIIIREAEELRVHRVEETVDVGDKGKGPIPPTTTANSDSDDDIQTMKDPSSRTDGASSSWPILDYLRELSYMHDGLPAQYYIPEAPMLSSRLEHLVDMNADEVHLFSHFFMNS